MLFEFESKTSFKVLEQNFTDNVVTDTYKGLFVVRWQNIIMSTKLFENFFYSWYI